MDEKNAQKKQTEEATGVKQLDLARSLPQRTLKPAENRLATRNAELPPRRFPGLATKVHQTLSLVPSLLSRAECRCRTTPLQPKWEAYERNPPQNRLEKTISVIMNVCGDEMFLVKW